MYVHKTAHYTVSDLINKQFVVVVVVVGVVLS